LALWIGATSLLLEDGWRNGFTVSNLLMLLLTGCTVAAAVQCHRTLRAWRPILAVLFLLLASLGNLATVSGTLGRQAQNRDAKQAEHVQENKTLTIKEQELATARTEAAKECAKIGPRCKDWQARVDKLTQEISGLKPVAIDARADAVARIAKLLGMDSVRAR